MIDLLPNALGLWSRTAPPGSVQAETKLQLWHPVGAPFAMELCQQLRAPANPHAGFT